MLSHVHIISAAIFIQQIQADSNCRFYADRDYDEIRYRNCPSYCCSSIARDADSACCDTQSKASTTTRTPADTPNTTGPIWWLVMLITFSSTVCCSILALIFCHMYGVYFKRRQRATLVNPSTHETNNGRESTTSSQQVPSYSMVTIRETTTTTSGEQPNNEIMQSTAFEAELTNDFLPAYELFMANASSRYKRKIRRQLRRATTATQMSRRKRSRRRRKRGDDHRLRNSERSSSRRSIYIAQSNKYEVK